MLRFVWPSGVRLEDPCESPTTLNILWFYEFTPILVATPHRGPHSQWLAHTIVKDFLGVLMKHSMLFLPYLQTGSLKEVLFTAYAKHMKSLKAKANACCKSIVFWSSITEHIDTEKAVGRKKRLPLHAS